MAFEIDLTGKTAVVIGGSQGIGAECCRQLAAAGADVVFSYYYSPGDLNGVREEERSRLLEDEIKDTGVQALKFKSDVSKEEEVKSLMDTVIKEFGKIDILVCNAAILMTAKFEEMKYETWRKMMDVILDGAYFCARHAIGSMIERKYGKIVFISTNAVVNGGGGSAAYPAAKAGVEGLAKQLVKEYAGIGISVNIVSPAVIDTDLFRKRYPTDEIVAEYGKSLPVGRVGTPMDIANAVVFLVSDKASYICGHNLRVDGGRTFYK